MAYATRFPPPRSNHNALPMVEFLIQCLFHTVCGWTGNLVVRLCTLGKVNLDWGADSESNVTEAIGMIFLLFLGIALVLILR